MMATTHALYGMAAGLATLAVAPEYAPVAMSVGYVAGFLPDLDVYANHRRSLHFPVYFSLLAVLVVGIAVTAPSQVTVAAGTALVALALHAVMDAAGGGLSLRPWEDRPDKAVYSHYHGRWVIPRRLIAYDGSPGDLLLAFGAGIPVLTVTSGPLRWLVVATLVVSTIYVLVRKRLVELVSVTVRYTPQSLHFLVPRRFDHLVDAE